MRERTGEVALRARPRHGEGPVWDERHQRLVWVDVTGRALHVHQPASGTDLAVPLDQQVGVVALRASGGLVLGVERGVAFLDLDQVAPGGVAPSTPVVLDDVVPVEADRDTTRANDGACDPHGRFWFGTMAHDATPGAGTLYRVDPDRTVHPQLSGLTIANGLAWDRDGATAWFIDSASGWVDRLVVDPAGGDVLERRPHLDLHVGPGDPDGLAVDAEGGLWIAMHGGWHVRRHDPSGQLDTVVRLPVARPTSCVLGGPGLDQLWITTTPDGLDDHERAEQPEAGSVFRCEVDVPGLPPDRFAG